MEENMSSTQEKPRDRVMALPEKLRKELLYLAHLDPERQKSTLLHNVAVSGEKIQQLIDSAKREELIWIKEYVDEMHDEPLIYALQKRLAQLEQSEESK